MPKGEIRKSPKPLKKKKSPEASKSIEVSQYSISTKKSQNRSDHPIGSSKKERKKESRAEYIPAPDDEWMKEARIREENCPKNKEDVFFASKESRRDRLQQKKTTRSGSVDPDDAKDHEVEMLIHKLHEKDDKTVATALEELEKEMSAKYLPDSLKGWTLTIGSALANIIENGKTNMASLAARAAALVCAQLGDLNIGDIDRMYTVHLRPALLHKLEDKSADSSLRALCAEAIGIFELIATDVAKMIEDILEELMSLALNLSAGKGVDISPGAAAVCIAALQSWCLILSGASSESTIKHSITRFSQFQDLLESSSVELRVASGKAMALLCELAEERGSGLTTTVKLHDTFHDLAKDKKVDVKYEQQKTFRDVLNTFENKKAFSFERKINTEVLYIDSWVKKIQYDAFCRIFRNGIDAHLQNNELLRSWFNLSSPLLYPNTEKPNSKDKRQNHAAAFKARTKTRQKLREMRTESLLNDTSD